jgi:hypothetical protein
VPAPIGYLGLDERVECGRRRNWQRADIRKHTGAIIAVAQLHADQVGAG